MKTKKILAIVTLVAFMISILPMAAFAAGTATEFGAIVEEKTISAVATNTDYLEYNIFVRSDDGSNFTAGQTLTIASSRGGVDEIAVDKGAYTPSVTTATLATNTNAQWINVRVKSNIPGTTHLAFGLDNSADTVSTIGNKVENYAKGLFPNSSTASAAQILNGKLYAGTFTSRDADGLALSVEANNANANGSSYNEVKAVVSAGNIPVSGKDVTFSITGSGATLSATKVTTDTKGEAKVKIFSTKPGTFTVKAKVADVAEQTIAIKFETIGITDIAAESDNNQKIAKESSGTFSFKFSFKDSNGNKITPDSLLANYDESRGEFDAGNLKGAELRVITKPSGADVSEKPSKTGSADINSIVADGSNLKITFNKSRFNKEGDYAVRLILANGKSVTYNFNVKEQGTVTGMTVKYDSTSLAGFTDTVATVAPTVKLIDAEGYATEVDLSDNSVTFTTSNPNLAVVGANSGIITVKKDAVGPFVLTALHADKNLVATTNFTIQKAATSLKATVPTYTAVGEDAKVTVQLVDVDGNAVSNNKALTSPNVKVIITEKPADSIVSVGTANIDDFQKKGEFKFDISSNKVGAVKFQVIATPTGDNAYAGTGTVNFGDVATAQKPLTMFVGATNYMLGGAPAVTDAAPFIENGRTFVAVRPIGDALGMTIYWDAATQTVTMNKPGEEVTIVVGASSFKVDRAGVVTEYPTDAPAKIKDGRTYLPFRAIGEAMGYEVNYDAATQAVTFK